MKTTPLLLLALAMIAFAFHRTASRHLKGSQKFFGLLAVVCTLLILLQPELLALGLLADTSFFDLLVLALTLQMHSYALQLIRASVAALSRTVRWLGFPSPGFSYILALLTLNIAAAISALQRTANRILCWT